MSSPSQFKITYDNYLLYEEMKVLFLIQDRLGFDMLPRSMRDRYSFLWKRTVVGNIGIALLQHKEFVFVDE